MKTTNSIMILSLIFGSLSVLFWGEIQDVFLDLDKNEVVDFFILIISYYLLVTWCMFLPTILVVLLFFRNEPKKKNNAFNMLLKFIGGYLIINIAYQVLSNLFFLLLVIEVIKLPLSGYGLAILPFLAVSFFSSAKSPIVVYGVPFCLSALIALSFYWLYMCLLSNEQKKTYVQRGFLIQLLCSSSIVGALDALYNKYLDKNPFLSFSLSIIYVMIFFLVGLLVNRKKENEEDKDH